jgi:hypothetical protein
MTLRRQVNIGIRIRVAVLYLLGLGQLLFGVFRVRLSAVETNSVTGRLMTQHLMKMFL